MKRGGFNFGYQLLITNPAQEAFIQFLNISYTEIHGVQQNQEALEFIWGVIVSTFFWGATLGSLLIQTIADWFGRKNGVILMFIVQIVSLLIAISSYFATSYIIYSISRLVLGVAISVSLGIGPMFIIECSPPACRGLISMTTGFMIQLGLVAGSITAMRELSTGSERKKKSCKFICILSLCYRSRSRNAVDRCSKCQQRGSTARPVRNLQVVNAFAFEILLSVGLNGLQASLANIVICLMALETWIGWCVVVSISIFNLVFATGPGPVCFLVPGELVGQRARAAAYTWVNIILNGVWVKEISF
uniref:MFS domain-containing protein n=1 Tax=Angiostrongylus cantonensis TaxID=6313 RepID=A0A0K0CVN2_ANGCA